ncbi:MAG: alpha/beta hydrolase [Bacteroidales bacterium]
MKNLKKLLFTGKTIKNYRQRVMKIAMTILSAGLFIPACSILARNPGKPAPFRDANGQPLKGSISEKIKVNINGVQQGMFIMGRDSTRPVLLFVHGGPGMPEFAVSRQYPLVLENHFTVCWWEQRGAGMSYNPDIPLSSMTFEQLIADILEVTRYLRTRFGQEKIYLMAHSGGTFYAIQAAARAPELFRAYIAVSQISNQLESEKLAYNYMVDQFTKTGDRKMLKRLSRYPVTEINTPSYYVMRDAPMHRLGIGTTHEMRSVISGVFWPVMREKSYTFRERINVWRGKAFNTKTAGLWNQLVVTDLTKKITKLEIPVYFLSGIYDYTVSYTLARNYFNQIEAPLKAFYTFKQSAHSPIFEEPGLLRQILLQDVLVGGNRLAD